MSDEFVEVKIGIQIDANHFWGARIAHVDLARMNESPNLQNILQ